MLDGAPPEDFGAETLARYGFQFALAARECVRMLLDADIEYIQCEWWEDFVVGRSDCIELVSVKHREPSQPPWTRPTLIDEGGLKHLCNRWLTAGEARRCRLLTNAGLSTSKSGSRCSAAEIKEATSDNGPLRTRIAVDLAPALGVDAPTVEKFLARLTIEDELPRRDNLIPRLLVDFLVPNCEVLGWPESECQRRFEVITALVFEVAQIDLASQRRNPATVTDDDAVKRTAELRRISGADVVGRLDELVTSKASRLQQKLEAGGLLPTTVEHCKRLRQRWAQFEHRWEIGLPGPRSDAELVRDLVLGLAAQAEATAQQASDGDPYGSGMREELRRLVEFSGELPDGVSVDLAMGAAFDESDRCHIYWSSDRDVVAGTK